MRRILTILLFTMLLSYAYDKVDHITIPSTKGGLSNGTAFDSTCFRSKTNVIMYVDPDNGDNGKVLHEAISALAKTYTNRQISQYMILNLADTWIPNGIIKSKLKSKQKENPELTFVSDEANVLLKAWDLKHDSYNCIVINDKHEVLYKGSAPFDGAEIAKITQLIEKNSN